MTDICSACEQGTLDLLKSDRPFKYSDAQLVVQGVEYARCPVCGEEMVLADQAKRNDVRYADARRAHDGLLKSNEIYVIREKLGVGQQEAAAIFGGGQNAFSKYERGEVTQSRSMDLVLRLASEVPEARAYLARVTGNPLGEHWVDVADAFAVDEVVISVEKLKAVRTKKMGSAVAAYHIQQQPNCAEANDGRWRDEPELTLAAYGK